MGLEKLFDLLLEFLDLFRFWQVVDQYEQGIVLQLGKFRRDLKTPGLKIICPFGIDQVFTVNVTLHTMNLRTQTLTQKDGKTIVMSPVLSYRIRDAKKFTLEAESADDALADITYGTVAEMVRQSTMEEMMDDTWHELLYKEVRRQGFAFGIEVLAVRLSDFGALRTIRLINSDDATAGEEE